MGINAYADQSGIVGMLEIDPVLQRIEVNGDKVLSFRQSSVTSGATNAPTNAVTNYNVVTTLLGTLTSAVNDANTKQNQIGANVNALAASFNDLLAKLGSTSGHGLIV